ncbi:NUDIX domain-containing protein [Bacteroidetes bacterium endosymbiont of Geopemphigus sp.]|uniref:NUDIX domain-containing protein n=1 Tax=Bacteroidetes bacterium endosymbiont of Geopemphigus sp. TaxID=2047937 RepID=UPI001F4D6D02|nr:NUDIX hydrolase [Bacteroidetes bacterium endosymbiont of Geopemphigus sp.]
MLEEPYTDKILTKFPGGALEFGEGLREALQREFLEELNLPVEIGQHFYTTDFFQPSAFKKNEQLIAIYYKVDTFHIEALRIMEKKIRQLHWIAAEDLREDKVTLAVDKKVVDLLKVAQ